MGWTESLGDFMELDSYVVREVKEHEDKRETKEVNAIGSLR